MKTPLISLMLVVSGLAQGLLRAADEPSAAAKNPLYAQCCFYGQPDPRYRTPAQQMKMLADLGYAGYSHVGLDGFPEMLKAVDENHLKLLQLIVYVSLDPAQPKYDSRLKDAIASLKGRDTVIVLVISGKPPSTPQWDPQAVAIVREIADLAAASGLRVAMYPHMANWIERVEDAVRVAKKSDRKNVGAIFNEVHFFLAGEQKNLEPTLKSVAPFLFVVSINGTDSGYKGQDLARLLQPLDRGSFDNLRLLKTLREAAYAGPISLHCYMIPGDVHDYLARSLEAWKKLSARLNAEKP